MNGAVLGDGWTEGGAEGARLALDKYWQRVSCAAAFSPLQRSPLDRLMGRWTLDTSPAYVAMDLLSRVMSPYDLNPFGINPLIGVLTACIDFERLAPHQSSSLLLRPMCAPVGGGSFEIAR
jgi:NTE family protein